MIIRVRTQLILLFLAIAVAGILGTAFSFLRLYASDKKSYVTELASTVAPAISEALERKVQQLSGEVELVEGVLREPKVGRVLASSISGKFAGAAAIELRALAKPPVRLALGPREADPELWSWTGALLARNGSAWSLEASKSGARFAVLAAALPSHARAAVVLDESFFADSFELSRGLPAGLVDREGHAIYRTPAAASLGGLPMPPLQALASSKLVAQELDLSSGRRVAATFSALGHGDRGYVVVFAPAVMASDLFYSLFKSSLGFLAAIVIGAVALGFLFSAGIARPIEELTRAATEVGSGHLEILLKARPRNEIGTLVKGFSKMVRSLSAREKELKDAQQKLVQSESLAAVGRFSSGIAHEVKNPLNSILGYAQLIERKGAASPDSASYLKFIMEETRRASRIISDLLMFSRQKPPKLERVDLGAMLEDFAKRLEPIVIQSAATLEVETAPGISLELDRDQLYQVILNLCQNALQAMEGVPEGRRHIRIHSFATPGRAGISLTDSGPGIAPEHLPRLFEPFFSTKEVGKGSGLGLALCHGIVKQHKGTIEAYSAPGEGATFEIELPLEGA